MDITISAAIIGAASGLIGATIPQIANWILTTHNYRRELKKEYQINKVQAYKRLFSVISEISTYLNMFNNNKDKAELVFNSYASSLNDIIIHEGIWFDKEEIDLTRNIIKDIGAIIIDEMERKANMPLSNFDSNLVENMADLLSICRNKARKAYFQK